jgi:hypothetical protein
MRVHEVPLQEATERIAQLKIAMGLPSDVPSWVAAKDIFPLDPTAMEIAQFGTLKVSAQCVHVHRRTSHENTDLSLYYRMLPCDFKAIHRYIKRQISAQAKRWLIRLSAAIDTPDIGALLRMGGTNARTAWALVLWLREVRFHGFDGKPGLISRAYWLALDPAIPTLGRKSVSAFSPAPFPDLAHLWLVRWICGAGLLRLWRIVLDAVARQGCTSLPAMGIRKSGFNLEQNWCVGISAGGVLTLCLSNGPPVTLVHAGTLV